MKTKKFINIVLNVLPLLLFTALLAGLLLIRILFNMSLPGWGAWGIGICWGGMAFGYLLRAELFKQIGEFAVTLLAVLILIGALIPKEKVSHYPQMASEEIVQDLVSTWNAVYTGNVFKHYSLQKQLVEYGHSLGRLDPFRHGKMILFGMLGFAMAICYLFPLEPPRRKDSRQKTDDRGRNTDGECLSSVVGHQSSGCTADLRSRISEKRSGFVAYVRRFFLLLLYGSVFAVQVELLQVLSPTRMVTGPSILDSCLGLLTGLLVFVPVHFFYVFLAEHRAKGSPRFNVLGVGVDAVNMGDCLKLFEGIIAGERMEDGGRKTEGECLSSVVGHQSSGLKARLPAMTTALGVAGIMEARRNPKMQRILNESVLNTPDGMPLVWLGKLFGYQNIERVYGPDLLRDVCAYSASKGWKHFFYGAAPGIVEKLKVELERKHPEIQVVGIYCPPFRPLTPEEEADLVARVAEVKPDIFWIGVSTPKQLYFMDQMRDKLDCKIICPVGYAFDVNAGVQEDAPDWAKYSGFQWVHRAIKQPRLWKRYLPDNPRFVLEVALQIFHLKKYPMLTYERDVKRWKRLPRGTA